MVRLLSENKMRGSSYSQYIKRKWLVLLALLLMMLAVALFSLSVGSSGLGIADIMRALVGRGTAAAEAIIWNVRLPKIANAIAIGMALAMSGCIMQNVLRNPLASASTLGVSQGASFGAAFAIVYLNAGSQINSATAAAVAISNPYLVTACAFAGGILTTMVILALTRIRQVTPATIILAGVALSALFGGATTLVQYFADDIRVASVVYWTFGDLGRSSWGEICAVFALSLLCLLFFLYHRWNYNAMASGMETAKSLGVPVDALMLVSMVLCSLLAAIAVAFVGIISFIGLIAPHMVRRLMGNDYRFLIPASALMGAVILLLAELVSRTIVSPSILPIGALTSFLGAPLFLYLIFKRNDIK